MSSCSAVSLWNAYDTFCVRLRVGLRHVDYFLGQGVEHIADVIGHGCQLSVDIGALRGRVVHSELRTHVAHFARDACQIAAVLRAFVSVGEVATGQAFFDLEKKTHKIGPTFAWKKWWICAQHVLAVAARILAPIAIFHERQLYNLGKGVRWVNDTILGLWMVISCIDIVDNAIQLSTFSQSSCRYTYKDFFEPLFGMVNGVMHLITAPFEAGYFRALPELAILGSTLGIVVDLLDWLKDVADFSFTEEPDSPVL